MWYTYILYEYIILSQMNYIYVRWCNEIKLFQVKENQICYFFSSLALKKTCILSHGWIHEHKVKVNFIILKTYQITDKENHYKVRVKVTYIPHTTYSMSEYFFLVNNIKIKIFENCYASYTVSYIMWGDNCGYNIELQNWGFQFFCISKVTYDLISFTIDVIST